MRLSILTTIAIVALSSAALAQSSGSNNRILSAAADYQLYCASCHGTMGRGNGPVADALLRPPADLTTLSMRNEGVFPRAQVAFIIDGRGDILAHGPREMPVWGSFFGQDDYGNATPASARERIEALSDYLKALQRQ